MRDTRVLVLDSQLVAFLLKPLTPCFLNEPNPGQHLHVQRRKLDPDKVAEETGLENGPHDVPHGNAPVPNAERKVLY